MSDDLQISDGLTAASAGLPTGVQPTTSLRHRLYHGETTFDFIGKKRWGFYLSGALLLITLVSLLVQGLNLGLDFEGGVAWEFPRNGATTAQVNDVLGKFGVERGAKVQVLSRGSDQRFRVQVGPQSNEKQQQVQQAFADLVKVKRDDVGLNSVSATWGSEITRKAVRALIIFFVLITVYISLRFEWKMAIAALVAMVHDVGISVGIYSVFRFEVTPATVIAFLTILGYSLYDTIVVFDKVHENTRRLSASGKATYSDIVNLSMNQVLMRSLNTSLAAILPVVSLLVVGSWILGAVALQEFALALFVGLITGSYSSIFIATPILAMLKEREPRYKALRQRLGARTGSDLAGVRLAAAGVSTAPARPTGSDRPRTTAPVATRAATPAMSVPPRPRKKKRR